MKTSIALTALCPDDVYVSFRVAHWGDDGSCGPVRAIECEYEITDEDAPPIKNELREFMPDYDEMHACLMFPDDHGLSDAEMRACFEVFKRVLRAKHMTICAGA